jgi:hypothetical protein
MMNIDLPQQERRKMLKKPQEVELERLEAVRNHFQEYLTGYDTQTSAMLEDGDIKLEDERRPDPDEIREAREIIAEFITAGEIPKVSVPRQYLDSILREGLRARPTAYQKGVSLTAGTIGLPPYLPADEDRVVLEVNLPPTKIEPRFTGRGHAFQGVVVVRDGFVPPEYLRVLDATKLKEAQARSVWEAARAEPFDSYRLISTLRGFFGEAFDADAGVWEKYTVGRHTQMVLGQAEKYVTDDDLNGLQRDLFRLMLAVHDIGKPDALLAGDVHRQYEFTTKKAEPFLKDIQVTEEDSRMLLTLLSGDPIGRCIQKELSIEQATDEIEKLAKQAQIGTEAFFQIQTAYYQSDASAYTEDAGGLRSLDGLFQKQGDRFARGTNNPLRFSPKVEVRIQELRDEIHRRAQKKTPAIE